MPVLSSLVSYGYLWNMVRVQGGAYGTGMNVRRSGDIFCYSYRDPNLDNTRAVFSNVADFIEDFAAQGMPLDDIIIGAVNTTDPLLDPAGVCESQCVRALKGVTPEELAKTRHELLATKPAAPWRPWPTSCANTRARESSAPSPEQTAARKAQQKRKNLRFPRKLQVFSV